jgi:hypothetical protein
MCVELCVYVCVEGFSLTISPLALFLGWISSAVSSSVQALPPHNCCLLYVHATVLGLQCTCIDTNTYVDTSSRFLLLSLSFNSFLAALSRSLSLARSHMLLHIIN